MNRPPVSPPLLDEVVDDRRDRHGPGDGETVRRREFLRLAEDPHQRQAGREQRPVHPPNVDLAGLVGVGVLDWGARQVPELDVLLRERERARDERLGRDDGGRRADGHLEVDVDRLLGDHPEERVGAELGVLDEERPLPHVVEDETREDAVPGELDRFQSEVTHVGKERLTARHRQDHQAQNEEAVNAVVREEHDGVPRIQHLVDDRGVVVDVEDPCDGQVEEPDNHDWPKGPPDPLGSQWLGDEQAHEDHGRDLQDVRLEEGGCHLQALYRADDRDRRGDCPVAVEQASPNDREDRDDGQLVVWAVPFGYQAEEGGDAAFALVIGLHDELQVFDRDDADERPENQREQPIYVRRGGLDAVFAHALLERVEGASTDVAEDHAECGEDHTPALAPGVAVTHAVTAVASLLAFSLVATALARLHFLRFVLFMLPLLLISLRTHTFSFPHAGG